MWFKKKEAPEASWMNRMDFRWQQIASHYDADKHEYVYITEPTLQFRRSFDSAWQDIEHSIVTMKPVAVAAKK